MSKKEEKKDLLENPEVIAEKLEGAEHWVEEHPTIVFSVIGVLLLAVGGYFGFRFYVNRQDQEAQREMFQAVRYFESDSLNLALKGDGNNLGFEQIIDDYSLTPAANLANFYAGAINLKQGKYQLAIYFLEDFSSNDVLVQARAYALSGDAYMELKDYDNAAKFYDKAASYKPNKYFSPGYLMKEALAYEKANQMGKAKDIYQQIIDKYWDSSEYQNARKLKARLETNS